MPFPRRTTWTSARNSRNVLGIFHDLRRHLPSASVVDRVGAFLRSGLDVRRLQVSGGIQPDGKQHRMVILRWLCRSVPWFFHRLQANEKISPVVTEIT